MTGGIADVGGLYDCLIGIATGRADDSILNKYNEIRRRIYRDFTDPVSTRNMRRLCQMDPKTAAEDPVLQMMNKVGLYQLRRCYFTCHIFEITDSNSK